MPNMKVINGKKVALSRSEASRRTKEEKAWEAARPLRDWQRSMDSTDTDMPRVLEDIIDALPEDIKLGINETTLNKYNVKKLLRARRPE